MRPSSILALALLLLPLLASPALGTPADDPRPIVAASEILAKIERGEPVEYDGVIVVGDQDLSGLDLPTKHVERNEVEIEYLGLTEELKLVESSISIRGSEIRGDVNLGNAIFKEPCNFTGTNFTGNVLFSGANFSYGDVDFRKTVFSCGDIDFWKAIFSGGNAYFREAVFSGGPAYFVLVEFSGGSVDFRGAVFSGGPAYFSDAVFSGGNTLFEQAKFSGGDANFGEAEFSGGVTHFWKAEFSGGGADFGEAEFSGGDADFGEAEFSGGDADFGKAKFSGGYANFGSAIFSGVSSDFKWAEFSESAIFENSSFYVSDLMLENSKISILRLSNAKFDNLSSICLNGTNCQRCYVHWDQIKGALVYSGEVYLTLVKNFKNIEYFEDADSCYYQYRRERQSIRSWLEWAKYIGEFRIT